MEQTGSTFGGGRLCWEKREWDIARNAWGEGRERRSSRSNSKTGFWKEDHFNGRRVPFEGGEGGKKLKNEIRTYY